MKEPKDLLTLLGQKIDLGFPSWYYGEVWRFAGRNNPQPKESKMKAVKKGSTKGGKGGKGGCK
jgi:hypothetical protein